MLKYVDAVIGLREIPDEISLCISISGCPMKCFGCHSSYLREDVGEPLTNEVLDELIKKNEGITCVCFMGGSNDIEELNLLAGHVCTYPNLKVAVYLGNDCFPSNLSVYLFNYIKIGHYDEKLGGLDSPTTNQKLKEITWVKTEAFETPCINIKDITWKFFKK